jgi:DNA-binding MarR family transcriptional regulator
MDLNRSANDLLDLLSLVIRELSGSRDLSLTAVATLGSLDRQGAQRITTLATAQGVSQPSMTQLVQRLEQRGLVVRGSDPADGRVALVKLTDHGRATLADRREQNADQIAGLLSSLSDAEVTALGDALAAVLPALRARLGSQGRPDSGAGK